MIQVISLIGALVILAAYAANQFGWMQAASLPYGLLNFVGSVVLGVVAVIEDQWGFILLEVVWAIISVWTIVKLLRGEKAKAGN